MRIMIKFPFTFLKKGLKVEFNYRDDVIPCKEVRITLNKKTITLSREDFSTLMAVFADEQQLEDMIQTSKMDFISIERMLKITTNKDLKTGESLVFPYVYWIPRTEYDKLKADGEMIKMVEDDTKGLIKYVSEIESA